MSYNAITLYFINGISRENTPYFASLAAQTAYFAGLTSKRSVTDSYYVPHYKDIIKLTSSDVSIFDKFNYLSINFSNKNWYYFIDSITYISEDVFEIGISLDSIQTFMFDIDIHESIIQRKFIDRWDNGLINRAYIRENATDGDLVTHTFEVINSNKLKWIMVAKFGSDLSGNQTFGPVSTSFAFLTPSIYAYNAPYLYHFTPLTSGTLNGTVISSSTLTGAGTVKPQCLDVFIIPFIPIVNYSIDNSSNITVSGGIHSEQIDTAASSITLTDTAYTYSIGSESINLGFASNNLPGVLYDSKYILQMLDENYINLTFGDNQERTSFPLSTMTVLMLKASYWADMSSGTRYYNIGYPAWSYDDNRYMTICSNNNVLHLDVKNDPWKDYLARNRATFAGAVISDMGSAVTLYARSIDMLNYNKKVDDLLLSKKSYDKRFKRLKLKSSAMRDLNMAHDEYMATALGMMGSAMDSSVTQYINTAYNLQHSPSSVKMTGDGNADIAGVSPYISYRIQKVRDFEQVAYYYHRYGYYVNNPFKSVWRVNPPSYQPYLEPFLTTLKSRYYFDYYKFQYADIDLQLLCSEDMIDDIHDRLNKGIRVWYLNHGNMCDYSHDNVEVSVLQ